MEGTATTVAHFRRAQDETLDIPIQSSHDASHCSLEASRKRYGTLLQDCSKGPNLYQSNCVKVLNLFRFVRAVRTVPGSMAAARGARYCHQSERHVFDGVAVTC